MEEAIRQLPFSLTGKQLRQSAPDSMKFCLFFKGESNTASSQTLDGQGLPSVTSFESPR